MDGGLLPVPEEPPARDWSLLPLDVLSWIFVRVGAVDVLMGAGLVCHSWLQAAKVSDVWRVLDMENHQLLLHKPEWVLCSMAKAAVNRSDGQLRVFAGKGFVTHELIKYILKRSPSLTTLRIVTCRFNVCTDRLPRAIRETPMLELRSLELDDVDVTSGELYIVLDNCPVLEVLRVRNCFEMYGYDVRLLQELYASRIKYMTFECDDEYRLLPSKFSDERYEVDNEADFYW